MSIPTDTAQDRDMVRLRAVFVPAGQTPPPELLAGMAEIVRLNVQLPVDAGQTSPDPSGRSGSTSSAE